jgi:His-Xaa-Ser system protein HxsD
MQHPEYEVKFSSAVYDLETIKRAAYRFSDKLSFNFFAEEDGLIVCKISSIRTADSVNTNAEIDLFKNEVLDQDLRRTIANETAAMRNAILAHTFSKTGLQSDEQV